MVFAVASTLAMDAAVSGPSNPKGWINRAIQSQKAPESQPPAAKPNAKPAPSEKSGGDKPDAEEATGGGGYQISSSAGGGGMDAMAFSGHKSLQDAGAKKISGP